MLRRLWVVGLLACGSLAEPWESIPVENEGMLRELEVPLECGNDWPGSLEEIAATPRVDAEAEHLALLLGGGFTADTAVYDRVRGDLAGIRSRVGADRGLTGRAPVGLVSLRVDAQTFAAMQAGEYRAWDCLHARYGWEEPRFHTSSAFPDLFLVSGRVSGRFAREPLFALYGALPGVVGVSGTAALDGSRICVDAGEDETIHYTFSVGSGDCPSGCMRVELSRVISYPDGRLEAGGEYSSGSGEPMPEWGGRRRGPARCMVAYGRGED